jgi:hypothetical protein
MVAFSGCERPPRIKSGKLTNQKPSSKDKPRFSADMRLTDLANEFGSDKGTKPGDWGIAHRYTEIYERFLRTRTNEPLRILEIGVWKGSSLRMWEKYFPNASIVGVDIFPETASIETKRAEVVTGDASDAAFLHQVVDERLGGSVDLVIDDGSHVVEHQIVALESLFPRLNDHGLYCVEDISVSRFASDELRRVPFYDFLDYAWALSELTTFFADFDSDTYHTIADLRFLASASLPVPVAEFWNLNLFGVYLFHNMCVFERHPRVLPEGVRESEDLTARLRPRQGNAFAYRKLLMSPEDEGWRRPTAAPDYARSIAAAHESLQERSVDIAVGRRLREANGSVPEALERLVTDCEQAFFTLKSQIAQIRSDADSLLKQYRDDQAMLTRALGKLNLREAEVERLRSDLEQANLKQHAVEIELVNGLTQNDALRAELTTTRTESDELRANIANASAQNDALRGELATGRAESDTLRADLANARAQNEALGGELAIGRATSDALSADLENARAQNDALRGELAAGRAESDALRSDQAHARAQSDWLHAELERCKIQLRTLKKSVSWRITSPLRLVKKGILWFLPGVSKPDQP